jgi:glycine oxidase
VPDLPQTTQTEILVIGAGVLGLCTAVELTRRGHQVRVLDPGEPNASGVAAGMIAPALEAVLDAVTPERAALFAEARRAWDGFAEAAGVTIHPARTIWGAGEAETIADMARALGFEVDTSDPARPRFPSDVLIEPRPAMNGMTAALDEPPIRGRAVSMARTEAAWVVTTETGAIIAPRLVLATGVGAAIAGLPEAAAQLVGLISPIRGQIGWVENLSAETVTRGRGIYVAPSGPGAVVGATMEPGRRDLEPDAEAGARLLAGGAGLTGHEFTGEVHWRVGVRGSTPDGLPLAGATEEAGLFMALAPRRNGWLLGALVARITADAIEGGGAGSPYAVALDPRRFLSR